jgi:hypothetical protein
MGPALLLGSARGEVENLGARRRLSWKGHLKRSDFSPTAQRLFLESRGLGAWITSGPSQQRSSGELPFLGGTAVPVERNAASNSTFLSINTALANDHLGVPTAEKSDQTPSDHIHE